MPAMSRPYPNVDGPHPGLAARSGRPFLWRHTEGEIQGASAYWQTCALPLFHIDVKMVRVGFDGRTAYPRLMCRCPCLRHQDRDRVAGDGGPGRRLPLPDPFLPGRRRVLYVRGGGDPFLMSEELARLAPQLIAGEHDGQGWGIYSDVPHDGD
jgi:hypothetical protein